MPRRKQYHPHRFGTPGTPWPWTDSIVINNRNVSIGTKLKFRGERGEFVFQRYVEHPNGDWIDVLDKNGQWRAIRADRVKTVKNKTKREKAGK